MWITIRRLDGDERVLAGYDTASPRVDLGDDLFIHEDVRVGVRGWGHDVDVRIVVVDGRLAAGEVTVGRHEGGGPVTSEALRGIPVGRLVKRAGGAVQHVRERHDSGGTTVGPAWPSEEEGAYVARHGLDDDTLRIVARVYRVAYLIGDPPTKKVEALLELPRSTAGRWVAAARERGYLSEARGPGKAGG